MQKLVIKGVRELSGKISISGSKNSTLPILAASILANQVRLKNIPLVKDIFTMVELLNFIGLKDNFETNSLKILKKIKKKLNFPVVIKPVNEGSSVGVYICNEKNFINNLKNLSNEKEILVEKYIPGREIQVAIMGKKKLGAIELIPKRKFYDYKAKYDKNAKTKHILPVNLTPQKLKEVENLALKAHKITKCKGITRSDFRYFNNKFYLLEVNTQPGMTELSLVPEIAKFKGISFHNLINWMIKDASINR